MLLLCSFLCASLHVILLYQNLGASLLKKISIKTVDVARMCGPKSHNNSSCFRGFFTAMGKTSSVRKLKGYAFGSRLHFSKDKMKIFSGWRDKLPLHIFLSSGDTS